MNRARMSVIILGFAVMVGMLMYPPWMHQNRDGQTQPMGYGFIWKPPAKDVEVPTIISKWIDINLTETRQANSIDFPRLIIQEVIALAITFGLAKMLARSPKSA